MRLGIADVIGHPWLAEGEIADADTVRAELARRRELHIQRAIELAERRAKRRLKKGVYRWDPYRIFLERRIFDDPIYLT